MKRILLPSIIVGLVISLTLAACSNLPSATKEPETVLPVEEGVDEPLSSEPLVATDPVELEVGSMMRWFDKSILVYVPKGEFIMGAGGDDNLQHTVYLDDFWIYKFKVTNEQYQLCVAAGACSPPADEPPFPDYRDLEIKDRPVIGVEWAQAESYCEWMNARLPTEAEWEKTARGPDGNLYPWGDAQADCSLLNFEECLLAHTSDVVDYPEGMSFYEAFDMAGNAYEWVGDWYQADYYLGGSNENPFGPDTGIERVIRGSSYKSNAELLPSARRFYLDPEKYREDLGFRCVVKEEKVFAPYCEEILWAPGLPAPWMPPGPSGSQPTIPPGDLPTCEPRPPSLSFVNYCANQSAQLGGANVTYNETIGGISGDVTCDNNNPMACWGPSATSFEVEVCRSCQPDPVMLAEVPPVCAPGYYLFNGICIFDGYPLISGGYCPCGFYYDPVGDVCIMFSVPSTECPVGYAYDPNTECCTAIFAPPSPDGEAVPPHAYPGCPIGYNYDLITNSCYPTGSVSGAPVEACEIFTVDLGPCRVPSSGGCTNPSQYGDAGSCTTAGCKWEQPATGGPGYCTNP